MEQTKIEGVSKEVLCWSWYRDKGKAEHEKQIRILEQELQDMQNSFDEMAGMYFTIYSWGTGDPVVASGVICYAELLPFTMPG